MAKSQREPSPAPNPVSRPVVSRPVDSSPPWGALVVAVVFALVAGATGHLVPGSPGLVAVGVVAVLAGAVALLFVKGPGASHGTATPQIVEAEGGKSRGAALLELESIRRQI